MPGGDVYVAVEYLHDTDATSQRVSICARRVFRVKDDSSKSRDLAKAEAHFQTLRRLNHVNLVYFLGATLFKNVSPKLTTFFLRRYAREHSPPRNGYLHGVCLWGILRRAHQTRRCDTGRTRQTPGSASRSCRGTFALPRAPNRPQKYLESQCPDSLRRPCETFGSRGNSIPTWFVNCLLFSSLRLLSLEQIEVTGAFVSDLNLYISPEIITETQPWNHRPCIDVWNLGFLIIDLLCGDIASFWDITGIIDAMFKVRLNQVQSEHQTFSSVFFRSRKWISRTCLLMSMQWCRVIYMIFWGKYLSRRSIGYP